MLVAGDFIALNGLARGGIAKLNIADGRVNTAFNPGTSNAFVSAMSINSSNQIAIGGSFQRVTGLPREGFAVFDAEVANTDFANGFEGQ